MLKNTKHFSIKPVADADILYLLWLRFEQLDLDMNVTMFIVEPADSIADIEDEIGFCILTNLFDDARFPVSDFVPSCEALEDHIGCYQMLFILSDGDDAIEIFIPKIGVDPLLLAMCSQFAVVLD